MDLDHQTNFCSSSFLKNLMGLSSLTFSYIEKTKDGILFSETRPDEKGRVTLQVYNDRAAPTDYLGPEFSIKTGLNEYGGKCFCVSQEVVYFFDKTTEAIYKKKESYENDLVYKNTNYYYADFAIHPSGDYLYCIAQERHTKEVSLVSIDLINKKMTHLHEGQDFYSTPRISSDGTTVAFITWNHPNMPWDESLLWKADIKDQGLFNLSIVYHKKNSSVGDLFFSQENDLYFTSNETDYYSLFKVGSDQKLIDQAIDFSIPFWIYGHRRIDQMSSTELILIGTKEGQDAIYLFCPQSKILKKIPFPFTSFKELCVSNHSIYFIAQSPDMPLGVFKGNVDGSYQRVKSCLTSEIENFVKPSWESLKIPTSTGYCYGFYYDLPKSPRKKCGIIIRVHGGPTMHVGPRFHLENLIFLLSGFDIFEINYSGSSGYGMSFQNRLKLNWGVLDTLDVIEAGRYLIKEKSSNLYPIYLLGSSAGGFTILNALRKSKIFRAAAVLYPVTDLMDLSEKTHKFEMYYCNGLIGEKNSHQDEYLERSPLFHPKAISTPLMIFHGKKDTVVPAKQSIDLFLKLKKTAQLKLFENESHGFKESKTIQEVITDTIDFFHRTST